MGLPPNMTPKRTTTDTTASVASFGSGLAQHAKTMVRQMNLQNTFVACAQPGQNGRTTVDDAAAEYYDNGIPMSQSAQSSQAPFRGFSPKPSQQMEV